MVKKSLVLIGLAMVLSGCTIKLPFNVGVAPGTDDPSDVFGRKPQAASIWKSADAGQTFEVKSRVDDTQTITKADVLSLSFHPNDSNIIYISTIDHGIFKTTDEGEYWEQIVFPPKKIYSFILDKSRPDERMFASGSVNGLGKIFRTEDGGETWQAIYTEPGNQVVITILAQHPRDTNVLFAGTSAGTVVKSTDGGETWRNVGGVLEGPITEIGFDAVRPMSLYAFSIGQKLYFSEDGGVTWGDPGVQLDSFNSSTTSTPQSLLSITADPIVSGRVYGSKMGGLYRSNDFAKTWEKINVIESAEKFPVRALAINPSNSEELVFTSGSAFYKTKNGGETWSVTDLYIDRGVSVLAYDPRDPAVIYMALRKFQQ